MSTFSGKPAGEHKTPLGRAQICVSNILSLNNQIGNESDGAALNALL